MNRRPAPARELLRSLGFGRAAYLVYHAPLAALRRCRREGGPWQQWTTRQHRLKMSAQARRLPPIAAGNSGAPEVCFLTGRRFWYQTAFCAWSLNRVADREVRFVFLDDGTLDASIESEAKRIFPGCEVISATSIQQHLDAALPERRFPSLRAQRRTYIHLRKLTDFHVSHTGWRMVLDSDMLFFRRPDALLEWLNAPARPVHMMDVQNCYGYSDATLADLAGRPPPARVNVGILGLRSDDIDWEKLECWCAQLIERHGTSYYLEQALVALLLAETEPLRLPERDYLLMPAEDECRAPRAIMHHYVDQSKRGYFRHAWRRVLAQA